MDENWVTLVGDDGEEVFEILDIIPMIDKEYAVLISPEEKDGTVLIMELRRNGTEEEYVELDDEELLDRIFWMFQERNKDRFEFQIEE